MLDIVTVVDIVLVVGHMVADIVNFVDIVDFVGIVDIVHVDLDTLALAFHSYFSILIRKRIRKNKYS
jgi:hypothetical protein